MTGPRFRTNPSDIARYFFHDCERFLYYSAIDPAYRRHEGIPAPEFDHSPIMEAILGSGVQWEHEVVKDLLKGRVVVAPGKGALDTRRISPTKTVQHLKREAPGRFLYQPTLVPPPIFYETFDIDPDLVVISDNHPDLIQVAEDPQGGRLLRVVDVKRGESLKLTHRVQILLYALELQALLQAEGIEDARVDLDRGAVWLGKQPEPEAFPVATLRPHLERFLRRDLGRILGAPAREARWHLYDRCEWCEFFRYCREEMKRTNDVSRLPQLTSYGKRHLAEEAGVQNLTQLGTFLKRGDADEVLDRCASLAGQRHHLAVRVRALETSTPQLHGASSPDLPQGENIAVFLTLQQEPLGQSIYLAGVLVSARENLREAVFGVDLSRQLFPEGNPEAGVWVAARPEEALVVRQRFVKLLAAVFQKVHRYNSSHKEWREQLSLQAYVFTETERGLLFTLMLEAMREADLAEEAMTLLFHFQGPELMHADAHPATEVAYPIVVLLNAVNRLLALPVEVSPTLPEILEALGSPYRYSRKDYYHFPLGHGFKAEALHAAWYGGRPENIDDIRNQGRLYLFAIHALLRAVREKAAKHLVAWPPRFTLPSGAGIANPLLSRLAFFARYESLIRCLSLREERAEARPTQVLRGKVLELVCKTPTEMVVLGDMVLEPEASTFPGWLLVRDNDEGLRAQIEYSDYWYRDKMYGPENPHRAVVAVTEVRTTGSHALLRLAFSRAMTGSKPRPEERFLLYPRFTDFTTDKIVSFLEQCDGPDGDLLLGLLRSPEGSAVAAPLPKPTHVMAEEVETALDFTPSQRSAYQAIRTQRVTAVWGPPGTGKTHFLATTILALAQAHASAGLPFHVLVTAFTHAAIENLLRKLAECQLAWTPRGTRKGKNTPVLSLAKVKYWQGAIAHAEIVDEKLAPRWLEKHPHAILGATAYSCLKVHGAYPKFDLVIIDEASQMRVPEAAVATSLVAPSGRLVLAGDHLQLPPIVAGTYPETPLNEPILHRSIFEVVCPRGDVVDGPMRVEGSRILLALNENFRMNEVLTGAAAHLLYGPHYRPATPTVAARRLAYQPQHDADPLVEACLDPDHPLVIVLVDGPRAARANPVEADLAAQLVVALRAGLRDEDGQVYREDAAFFRHGVFVVSPHHAQIQAIQRELAKLRSWTSTPFVDTVDKMQGQEAEAVVVSYGVADPEFALNEAEFIYGLNRLNVALTRARSKCVLCLPRPLVEASPQVLDIEPAARGLAFMRRLIHLVETCGERLEFEGDGAGAEVLRLKAIPKDIIGVPGLNRP